MQCLEAVIEAFCQVKSSMEAKSLSGEVWLISQMRCEESFDLVLFACKMSLNDLFSVGFEADQLKES